MSVPGCLTAIPSAIVYRCSVPPAKGQMFAAWTPMMRTSGVSARRAIAIPAASPPPPIGTITVPPSGSCSASSSPIVPCPAITRSSSNAWTNVAPVESTRACAAAIESSKLAPTSST